LQSVNVFSQVEKPIFALENYTINHLQEKVFAHTDKENYVTGEILWFKLYLSDALLNKPLNLSKIAYIEILDKLHKPILQSKIAIKKSMGDGSFLLPYSLQSGNYIFRCYTGLMKNSTADFYFEKQLTIINPFKKPNWAEAKSSVFNVQFFPEGGNLVSGMESKIGFKVTDQYGKSFEANGFIENESKQKIVQFKTSRFGMGQFLLTPESGNRYKAIVEIEGKKMTYELPIIYQNGVVFRLIENSIKQIVIAVQASKEIHHLELLVHSKKSINALSLPNLVNGKLQFVLPDSLLGEGMTQFTLFDEQHQPLCERLFFRKPVHVLEIDTRISTKSLTTRGKVDLSIHATDNLQPVVSNFSLSVFLIDSLQTAPHSNLLSYLWLESDLKGEIEAPEYYFSDAPDLSECSENLLLTQGWRRFQWNDVFASQKNLENDYSELNGHLIWAKVTKKLGGQQAEGVTVYMSLPGIRPTFNQGISDKNGLVLFNIPVFYGNNQLILQTNRNIDSNYQIDLIDPYSTLYSSRKIPAFELQESLANLLKAHSIQAQVGNIYYPDQQQKFSYPEEFDTIPFFGKSTHGYLLDDYTRFITMEEVLKEYVEGIRLRKTNSNFNLRLYNESYKNYFETEPLVLLDGVPVFDINQFISFNPLKIRRIDVLNQQFYQNKFLLNGILSCNTYKGDLDGFSLDPNALVFAYEGLQLKREFYQPAYQEDKKIINGLPDFRNVLLWNPTLSTDLQGNQKVSFYNSDIAGKYLVVIQGLSQNGVPGFSQTYFEVK
jgi:hypothetical protein